MADAFLTIPVRLRPALCFSIWFLVGAILCSAAPPSVQDNKKDNKKDEKKDDKKKSEPLPIRKLTQGLGFYGIGPLSSDKQQLLLLAQKPDSAPNVYIMNVTDFSIRAPLTSFKWGAGDPQWSSDGASIAFAGFGDTATFSDLYVYEERSGKLTRLTSSNFTDKEPVFTPDGKRILFTTDESPLPDAAFGILHIASVPVSGGKPEYFTEDEVSTVRPGISADNKSVLLVKIDEHSGRHSLWRYGLDGKPQQDLTQRKFARIHQYITRAASEVMVIWGQEEVEQQDNVYILDLKTMQVRDLPDPDVPKRNPAVSPNGILIAFTSPTPMGTQLFVFDSATGLIQQVSAKGARTHSPVFIANDKLLFGSDRDKASELYLLDLAPPPSPEESKKKK
jgi:Tol biopolymer transport system component